MQVFTPYTEPLRVAECLDPKRLRSQINECKVILEGGWVHHPISKMYKNYVSYLCRYMLTLQKYSEGKYKLAKSISKCAMIYKPDFLTTDFIDQHKRRLYTKNPKHYAQWAELGTSEENWYSVGGEIWKYCNGKRI